MATIWAPSALGYGQCLSLTLFGALSFPLSGPGRLSPPPAPEPEADILIETNGSPRAYTPRRDEITGGQSDPSLDNGNSVLWEGVPSKTLPSSYEEE